MELYRERPCLWKIKDPDYINKNLKREAYGDLIKFLKSKNYNDVTIKDVKTKIQNMRNAFRRECKKIENSNRSGSGTADIYVPTLW
ncbi:hypothetical protein NQ314_008465 [Rhamnusium bicolor]|uniref:MADF domain-containing protein n=1 Tax=Rhamnusium bicolor TaxID=1586634 RepID=A0AAV8YCI1_9CUCU|nr:hypothetical protein NQ314_008465 [Rhamnusium bicolor]